jgi:hypothetical protein
VGYRDGKERRRKVDEGQTNLKSLANIFEEWTRAI